mmetsp:Transcript_32684/g.70615  ORF Transcript_32684/g.70615 Transcript_32684/m.70615 type:complete len:267 (-) Transcript_32684:56-856(-)
MFFSSSFGFVFGEEWLCESLARSVNGEVVLLLGEFEELVELGVVQLLHAAVALLVHRRASEGVRDIIGVEADGGRALRRRAVHQPAQAGEEDGREGHGARLARGENLAVRQVHPVELLARLPDREHLRVRRGVSLRQHGVVRLGDDLPRRLLHDDRAEGPARALLEPRFGLLQHQVEVVEVALARLPLLHSPRQRALLHGLQLPLEEPNPEPRQRKAHQRTHHAPALTPALATPAPPRRSAFTPQQLAEASRQASRARKGERALTD